MSAKHPQPAIREDNLCNPRYPVHKIADRLRPYLEELVRKFTPKGIILFGSYAYGTPDADSDIDLLVVREGEQSSLRQRMQIRNAWWNMPRKGHLLPFDLIVVSPEEHKQRLANSAGFYETIVAKGLPLL
jgi:predicted nucleotidyltransferase